jgi:protein O-GlcNAc transferase
VSDLDAILAAARTLRESGDWSAAGRLYDVADGLKAGSFETKHNLALCHLGLGAHAEALRYSRDALLIKPDLWQSRIIQAKVLRADGLIEEAAQALKPILKHDPLNGHALLALADIEMNEFGDPLSAISRVAPLRQSGEHQSDAELTSLMAKLYDRDETDEEISDQLRSFSSRALRMPSFEFDKATSGGITNNSGRLRVGLLSPLFCASPVYYFTIGALRLLSREVDLIVFSRGARVDWATRAFRTVAREWHQVQHLPAEALANAIKRQNIDVLFDLGGWMDPVGLKALSVKPAKRLYKWVGGQSATTGLNVFDGFISDIEQSPIEMQNLYSEPLINIPGGYVSYQPNFEPADFPVPNGQDGYKFPFGVIGNPAKLSREFINYLDARLDDVKGDILLVDRRYKMSRSRERVRDGLSPRNRSRLIFVAPTSHNDYLAHICRPRRILDTFPYNGGLTSVEAMFLNKPVETRSGKLFSSRHTVSHYKFTRANGNISNDIRKSHLNLAVSLTKLIMLSIL